MRYPDTVFPTFVFLSGMSPTNWQRNAQIVGLGLAYNAIGNYIGRAPEDQKPFRIPGVLQRIGLASMWANTRADCNIFPLMAAGAYFTLTLGLAEDKDSPLADPTKSGHAVLDRKLFGADHLYKNGFDPEGVLGVATTAVTSFLGWRFIRAQLPPLHAAGVGAGAMAVGWLWAQYAPDVVPLSKPYWTPSFTIFSAGFSILKYTAVGQIVPYLPNIVKHVLECLGQRSLEIYMVSGLIHALLRRFGLDKKIKGWLQSVTGSYTAADLLFVAASNALMAYGATEFVEHGIRLRLPIF